MNRPEAIQQLNISLPCQGRDGVEPKECGRDPKRSDGRSGKTRGVLLTKECDGNREHGLFVMRISQMGRLSKANDRGRGWKWWWRNREEEKRWDGERGRRFSVSVRRVCARATPTSLAKTTALIQQQNASLWLDLCGPCLLQERAAPEEGEACTCSGECSGCRSCREAALLLQYSRSSPVGPYSFNSLFPYPESAVRIQNTHLLCSVLFPPARTTWTFRVGVTRTAPPGRTRGSPRGRIKEAHPWRGLTTLQNLSTPVLDRWLAWRGRSYPAPPSIG